MRVDADDFARPCSCGREHHIDVKEIVIGEKELPLNLFEVVDIEDRFPVKRVKELLNEKK